MFLVISGYVFSILQISQMKDAQLSEKNAQISDLQDKLTASIPSQGNHFIEISDRVAEIDCPKYSFSGYSTGGNTHCAYALSLYTTDPSFQLWFGTIEVTGTYMKYEKEDFWAIEGGAPEGTSVTCHSVEVVHSSPEFNGKLFQNEKHVTLPPTIISLPFEKLNKEQQDLLSNSSPEDAFRYIGIRDTYDAKGSGVCGSGFDYILDIQKI